MKKMDPFSRLSNQQPSIAMIQRIAGCTGVATLLMMTGLAAAQNPAAPVPAPETQMSVPDGYTAHQSVDVGVRVVGVYGSGAMYDTLVNMQTGPRVQGETFEMHALPGNKDPFVDTLRAVGNGFGGDPNNFAKLDFAKGKLYEFSGLFRRDRQYFDYDLLGNPNIPGGQSIPIGPTASPTGAFPWPQVTQSSVMYNTVRRMTDTSLTLLPISKVTYRIGYSQNIFEGPSNSPSGYQFAKYDAILREYQRNSNDDFLGAIDWKPVRRTRVTFEEQIVRYKADSYFTLAASDFVVQEADGTPAALNDYDSLTPYPASACTASSMGGNPMLLPSPTPGGLPVINAACAVVTSYLRSQPTRILFPTEIIRVQSSSIKNVTMNGDFRYTRAKMNMPDYYDSYQGLNGATRSATYVAAGSAKRNVLAIDYGLLWQATSTFSLAEQFEYSDTHQPGTTTMLSVTTVATPKDTTTPPSTGNETIFNTNLTTTIAATGAGTFAGSGSVGVPLPGAFDQTFLTNNLTASWDVSSNTILSVTYRYRSHLIGQGIPDSAPLVVGSTTNGTVTINENAAIFNAAVRPSKNWDINGTVEVAYADNAFTPVGPRQTKHFRLHTMYRPKPWATFSGAFNDLERHNNTNNNAAAVAAGDDPYEGPLNHVDHSRIFSAAAALEPNEHYGLDFNYAYSDVYTATNICYDSGASPTLPGSASINSSGGPAVCPGVFTRGSKTQLADWFGRDFMDAPTQYGSVAFTLSPVDKLHSSVGYRISAVNGTRFFTDSRDVNGSLVSTYQSPFLSLAYAIHRGWIVKGEYNYFSYGEGGPSGPQYCSTSTALASTVVPCTSLYNPAVPTTVTGLEEPSSGLTAAREFHASNVSLGMHFEF